MADSTDSVSVTKSGTCKPTGTKPEPEKVAKISGQSQASGKKKLGKNLNKLSAPPSAQNVQGGTKSNCSDKNGLLLLSTKRTSTGKNTVGLPTTGISNGGAGGTGGILSTKTGTFHQKPLPNLGLHTESNASTHNALMGVVVGASRVESKQPPDAWKVAVKQPSEEKVDLNSMAAQEQDAWLTEAQPGPGCCESVADGSSFDFHQSGGLLDEQSGSHLPKEFHISNWDEYGGRNVPLQMNRMSAVGYDNPTTVTAEREKHEKDRILGEVEERPNERLREKQSSNFEETGHAVSNFRALDPSTAPTSRGEWSQPRKLFEPNPQGAPLGINPKQFHTSDQRSSGSAPYLSDTGSDSDALRVKQQTVKMEGHDDQGRSDLGTGVGPRMLYDPKSGSMVEVTGRGYGGGSSRNRRERTKMEGTYLENKKDGGSTTKVVRKGKDGPTDDRNGQPGAGSGSATANTKKESRKGKIAAIRRLPRTCGVLFIRDGKGTYVCADKCDGDLGYGVHSVPGGRIRNSSAYTSHLQHNKKTKNGTACCHERTPFVDDNVESRPLQESIDWIKQNEKIELLSGLDDSPTLKANASEWVPSNTAFLSMRQNDEPLPSSKCIDDKDDDGVHVDEQFGLGFDPASNMDSMMQSPSIAPSESPGAMDLASLSFEPALRGSAKSSHSIFAFESGSTWGNSTAATITDDWAMTPSQNTFESTVESQGNNGMPASFLSLSSSTWGDFNPSVENSQTSASKH